MLTINVAKLSPEEIKRPRVVSIVAEEDGQGKVAGKEEAKAEL